MFLSRSRERRRSIDSNLASPAMTQPLWKTPTPTEEDKVRFDPPPEHVHDWQDAQLPPARATSRKCLHQNMHFDLHENQTEDDPAWFEHERHILIFTNSGKPVFTRYGHTDGVPKTTAGMSAIVSRIERFVVDSHEDCLKYLKAGSTLIVFRQKGPLWFVCASHVGDVVDDVITLLDMVHNQVLSILTQEVKTALERHPGYDIRGLLGGTHPVVNSLLEWASRDMILHVDGIEPLPLAPHMRTIATGLLKDLSSIPNLLFGMILAEHRVVSLATNKHFRVSSKDLLLVTNLVMSSASLRQTESWTPICLPHLDPGAYVYAYVYFIPETNISFVIASPSSDGDVFFSISQSVKKMMNIMEESGCRQAILESIDLAPLAFPEHPMQGCGLVKEIVHAAYCLPPSQQFFSSTIVGCAPDSETAKQVFRTYGDCRKMLKNSKKPAQICVTSEHECYYVWLTKEFEMFLCVPRGTSTGVIGQFLQLDQGHGVRGVFRECAELVILI